MNGIYFRFAKKPFALSACAWRWAMQRMSSSSAWARERGMPGIFSAFGPKNACSWSRCTPA